MKQVLVIEDDKTLRENTRELLGFLNYSVLVARDGVEGVELAIRYLPDIILCDILMPRLDGYGVYRSLNKHKATRSIPFIFMSAKTEPADIRKGMVTGADDYITKPFIEQDLIDSIESRLAKHAILSQNQKSKEEEESHTSISSLDELRDYFIEIGEQEKVRKNKVIYRENTSAQHVFMIRDGLIKTHSMDEYGKELVAGVFQKNDFFGIYHFCRNSFYPETATSLEGTCFYKLPNTVFQKLLPENPQLSLDLAQLLSDHLSNLKSHLLEMVYASVMRKTTSTILQFADIMKNHSDEPVKISRSDLASVAGISTESFIRSLSSLRKDGIIDLEGKTIKILNLKKLQSIR